MTMGEHGTSRKQRDADRGLDRLSVRLPTDLLEELGEYASRVREEAGPLERPTIAAVIARVLRAGLKDLTRPRKGAA